MSLANKALDAITEADLQELIDNQVAEGKEYDYKLMLWGSSDSDKKEFLADVSSFANTVGGHLIVGMDEVGGIPSSIPALKDDLDAAKLRMENMLRDSIAPRIQGIDMKAVPIQTGNVLIIRIPRSWSSPHMVTFAGNSRFYGRNSAGKYQLDVNELRSAFTLSETATERIRNFRLDRIAKIAADDTPIKLNNGAKFVFHVIPIEAFTSTTSADPSTLVENKNKWLVNLGNSILVNDHRHNLDGLLFYSLYEKEATSFSYVQFFRNGVIELADAWVLQGERKLIPSDFEKILLELLPIFCSMQEQMGMQPPVIIMLTLLGVEGYTMAVSNPIAAIQYRARRIDRDDLLIPDVLIENFAGNFATKLKPVFDIIWNACGYPYSLNYGKDGNWNPSR